ncbi:hypothetical protein [Pseudonocardia asaccharolytica]|uniref:Uncharacterized protein n=1 Tax=Pseudonocardia asaccharolytica DSM 44247 = NBRC 16224 TaxID=1123024 RepID=A0A511D3F1_9PSEU|nr:hypothetical protein [Pseudonocardia asaccharolytica]GEL19311.1 hypothetical protein PA7_31480 [Pseudonocardia asaccharolytica DSM 44247 = NBRC 16224]
MTDDPTPAPGVIDLSGVRTQADLQLVRDFAIRRYIGEHGVDYTAAAEAVDEQIISVVRQVFREVNVVFAQVADHLSKVAVEVFDRLGRIVDPHPHLVDQDPPTDPRERALWLRRHRHTGPAPARLDGRKTRR